MIDSQESFDLHADGFEYDPDVHEEIVYRFEPKIVYSTFIIYMICNFCLFMIFMNFIITMIGESYGKVKDYADAHDYKERVLMIYEREIHFT